MGDSVEVLAIKMAVKHYEDRGWKVENVSRVRKDHLGYDLSIERGSEKLKIEVKGSAKPYDGIPDLHSNEIDEGFHLIADYLFVAYFPLGLAARSAIIPRDAIECGHPKITYSIHLFDPEPMQESSLHQTILGSRLKV